MLQEVGIKRVGIGRDVGADMSRDPRLCRTFCRQEEEVIGHKVKTLKILNCMYDFYIGVSPCISLQLKMVLLTHQMHFVLYTHCWSI
jgi:hypothetical protein